MRSKFTFTFILILLIILPFSTGLAFAQQGSKEDEATVLAKKVQNPVSDLISLPFENNLNFGYGPNEETQYILNIKPVIPLKLTRDWNLITRAILPVIDTPWPESKFGLGDLDVSLFFSPSKPSKFLWGVGPVLSFPSATDEILGSEKWSAGPTAAGVYMNGPWVNGLLINNLFSYAGDSNRANVNQMLIESFINYDLPKGWSVGSSLEITADWKEKDSGNRWTIPVGGGVSKVLAIGKQSMNLSIAAFKNVKKPDIIGPDWTLEITVQLLFPK